MVGTVAGVAALVPTVGEFSEASTPQQADVELWLEEASALIYGALASAGYSTTVDEDAAIYPVLTGLAQLYAAATVLQARGIDTASGGEENRSTEMFARFYRQLAMLGAGNLEALGVSLLATAPARRRGFRTRQMRRIDGYSGTYEGSATQYSYPSE